MENKKAYRIEKLYADANINDDDKKGLTEVRLEVALVASDWYKFQSQPFYQEMLRYLDNVKIQKIPSYPVQERSSAES